MSNIQTGAGRMPPCLSPSWLPCWSDWSSYYHFNYSGYRWRLLRDGRRWFFFSSRRRHTRFDCDWSSDVCSSDLCREVQKVFVVLNDALVEVHIGCIRGHSFVDAVFREIGRASCRERV